MAQNGHVLVVPETLALGLAMVIAVRALGPCQLLHSSQGPL